MAANLVPRFACAGILLAAAALKCYELATDPALGTVYGHRWLQILLVEYEILLASWLLCGVAQWACRWVALGTFGSFGSYALYLGMTGAASCGCFGRMQISPWWTFGLDCIALLLLWCWRPRSDFATMARIAGLGAVPIVAGIFLLAHMAIQPRIATADGVVVADSFVLLEPEKWVGKPFPLFEQIDIGERLRQGSWTLLVYHHDCPQCQELLAQVVRRPFENMPLALIEVPPHAAEQSGAVAHGRLIATREWFVRTPVEILISDGVVRRVSPANELLSR